MAFNLGDILVTFKSNTDDLKKGLTGVQNMAKGANNATQGVTDGFAAATEASKAFALGVAVVGAAVVGFGVMSVKAFSESEDLIAQTNAVLKSTGGIAGVTADQVTKLATALESQTKFSDESVRSVENLLLTFTAISKDIFPQATETVLDMATALKEDTGSAAIQLGKALQDPVLGVTALRRVGVNFNESQQAVIKNLVDTGQSAKAQQLIMAELSKEFGGSAKAAGETFAGRLSILKNKLNNVQEGIGLLIVKGVEPLVNSFIKWYDAAGGADGIMQKLSDTFNKVAPYLPMIAGGILGGLVPAFLALAGAIWLTLAPLIPWILAGAAIAGVASVIINNWGAISGFFTGLWKQITDTFSSGLDWLKNNWASALGFMIGFVATLPIKLPVLMFDALMAMVNVMSKVNWGQVASAVGNAFGSMWEGVKNAALGVWHFITNINWGATLVGIGKGIGNTIIDLIQGALNGAFAGIPGHPHVNLPHFATGVQNFRGGFAVVGENGPEVAYLPPGTSVIPNGGGSQLGGNIFNVTINKDADTDYFFAKFGRNQLLASRGMASQPGSVGA